MGEALNIHGVRRDIKALALNIAGKLFGVRSKKRDDFARELIENYIQCRGKDLIIIYNTGGFGGTFMKDDPEWGSVVRGIQSEIAKLGYSSLVLEHTRSRFGLWGFIGESLDLLRNYSRKAWVLAAKINFVTGVDRSLKIIVTGRSFGAMFTSEVMRHMEKNLKVYSIQAGLPFWYHPPQQPRSLMIKNNGSMPDSFSRGDLRAILRANLSHFPSLSEPRGGAIKIGPLYFRSPGHEYNWEYTDLRERITDFLHGLN